MADTYKFDAPDGPIELPLLNQLPTGAMRKIRRLKGLDVVFTVLEEVTDDTTLERVDNLSHDDFNRLLEGWQEASGIDLGESSASSSS